MLGEVVVLVMWCCVIWLSGDVVGEVGVFFGYYVMMGVLGSSRLVIRFFVLFVVLL